MSDNKKLKRADAKRVALLQTHERDYLLVQLRDATLKLNVVLNYAGIAYQSLARMERRLRAGFPAKPEFWGPGLVGDLVKAQRRAKKRGRK